MTTSFEPAPADAASPKRLPLSVIIPTNNESARIPAFLTSLDRWLDLAEDVAVVDEYSADGTIELLRSGLYHRRAEFHQRAFGLASAINFGVTQLQSDFIYIARPGNVITRDGITHLVDTAQHLGCDVLLSPPREDSIQDEAAGREPLPPRVRWPVEQLLAAAPIVRPRVLRRTSAFHLALANALGGRFQSLLGGISSVLFRADALRARPFDEGCGSISDALWILQHGLEISVGVTPQACASFHAEPEELSKRERAELRQSKAQAPALAEAAIGAALRATEASDREDLEGVRRYFEETCALLEARGSLSRFRQRDILWFLRPAAWRARTALKQHQRAWREAETWLQNRPRWRE